MRHYQKVYGIEKAESKGIFDGHIVVEEKLDGCVGLNERILMADLTYKQAGLLQVGEKIIAFQDKLNDPRLIEATVTHNKPIKKECYLVTTETRSILATSDHPFLVSKRFNQSENTNNSKLWVKVNNLKVGDKIVSLPIWNGNNDWKTGYIAGIFDGEASLVRYGKSGRVLSYYQKIGKELDMVFNILKQDGFNFSLDMRQRNPKYSIMGQLTLRKDWTQILKFLGYYRPQRLLNKAKDKVWDKAPLNKIGEEKVVSVTKIGKRLVAGLSTSSHTYIAEGMFSHNSQFRIEINDNGVVCGSHKVDNIDESNGQFKLGIQKANKLFANYCVSKDQKITVFCEYMPSLRTNAISYNRVPKNNLVVFDVYVQTGDYGRYLSYDEKKKFAEEHDLECIYKMWEGDGKDFTKEKAEELLKMESPLLGNDPNFPKWKTVEGIVIKNYNKYHDSVRFPHLAGMFMCSKWVNAPFQELNKSANPTKKDQIEKIYDMYRGNEARFRKAIQHLEEEGKLLGEMKDLALLIPEVKHDIELEEAATLKEAFYKIFMPKLLGLSVQGLPEFYKRYLIEKSGNI